MLTVMNILSQESFSAMVMYAVQVNLQDFARLPIIRGRTIFIVL